MVDRFLHLNNMDHILRAHQLCNAGYQVGFFLRKEKRILSYRESDFFFNQTLFFGLVNQLGFIR